jgi:hypothetical protein
MNHSKYTKFDPKHDAAQPAAKVATVEVPSSAPAIEAKPAVAVVALQPATQVQVEATPQQDLPAPKAEGSETPTVMNAGAVHEDSSEAMVSEGAPAHAATGETTTQPAARVESEGGEVTPALSAKPLS